jgi:hypothetical protein
LPAGSYKLSFGDLGAKTGLRGEYYNNATTLAASKSIVVGFAQKITGINAELAGTPVLYVSANVFGMPIVGSQLSTYAYTVPSTATATYQWHRKGVAISGATKLTYTLVGADAGKTISVTVKAALAGYTSASGSGSLWSTVSLGTFATVSPTVTGTAKVGATLTAKPGITVPKPAKVT